MPAPAFDHLITECWERGDTIGEARDSIVRRVHQDPGFERVQALFARLSHEFLNLGAPSC